MLPHSKAHVVVVTGADNHALRYMDVTVPVELQDNYKAGLVCVLRVAYNKDLDPALNKGNVLRTTNASKRCHFQSGNDRRGGGEEGGNDDKSIIIVADVTRGIN